MLRVIRTELFALDNEPSAHSGMCMARKKAQAVDGIEIEPHRAACQFPKKFPA
jgi:hypothetical protein